MTIIQKSKAVSYSRNKKKIIFLYKLSRIIYNDIVFKMYVSSIYSFSCNVHESRTTNPRNYGFLLRFVSMTAFFSYWRDSPPVGLGLLIHEVCFSRSHRTTHHSR